MADCQTIVAQLLEQARVEALSPDIEEHLEGCAACRTMRHQLRGLEVALIGLTEETASPPPFERLERRAHAAARRRRRQRVVRRLLPAATAFVGAVLITAGVTGILHRRDARPAVTGDVLDASHGVVQATLADAAHLTVPSGRVVVELSERLHAVVRLDSGAVFLNIPHLDTSASFVLTTDEAEVRVHGTRFDVTRVGQGTKVNVTEGTVEVRPRSGSPAPFLLRKGESYLLVPLSQQRLVARAVALAALDQRDDSTTDAKIQEWLAMSPPPDEAAEAYALLAWKKSRDGDRPGALASYRRALALLPPTARPLWADNACAQLALLLEQSDTAAGRVAWRDYLVRFPRGVHAAIASARLAREIRALP